VEEEQVARQAKADALVEAADELAKLRSAFGQQVERWLRSRARWIRAGGQPTPLAR